MSREVKFRYWWHNEANGASGMCYSSECNHMEHFFAIYDPNMGDTLMQYTGLGDRDGADTYEGDIVDHPDGGLCVIKFADGHFYAEDQAPTHCLGFDLDRCAYKVVGNIHENPELIAP